MIFSEKGSVLVIVITGITIIAVIGAGVAAMVSSGARTGANHSLSVQAFYAAESGLEWVGKELRDSVNWTSSCVALEDETEEIGQANFTIVDTVYDATGCEITVIGWVGDEDNPLAKRQIKGTITEDFVTNEGVNPDDFDEFYANDEYEQINVTLNGGGDVYIADYVQVNNDIGLNINGGGNIFIGNNVSTDGRIIINISGGGDVCIGDNISIDNPYGFSNALIINISGNGNVCIKSYENLDEIDINITGGNSSVCFEGDSGCSCSSSFCGQHSNGDISQDPTDQGGTWSEG
jgi:Tfp pilus assembly protein PilX